MTNFFEAHILRGGYRLLMGEVVAETIRPFCRIVEQNLSKWGAAVLIRIVVYVAPQEIFL